MKRIKIIIGGGGGGGSIDPEHEKLSSEEKLAKTFGVLRYIFGILFIMIGLFKAFFGKRFIKHTSILVTSGFFFGFIMNIGLLCGLDKTGWAMIPASILSLPLGILFSNLLLYKYFFGANIGLIISIMINSLIQTSNLSLEISLSVILPIIFGYLSHFIKNKIVIISTPFIGSNMFITGISLVINKMYIYDNLYLLDYKSNIYWILFSSTFLISIIAFYFQYFLFGLETREIEITKEEELPKKEIQN